MMNHPLRLTLFLTHLHSLRTWYETGSLEREIALYKRLQELGIEVQIVSYGGREEYEFRSQVAGMRILCNWIGWSNKRYSYRLHQLHGLFLWRSEVYKTNQMNGAEIALKASQVWKKPLIARMGYMWSEFSSNLQADNVEQLHRVEKIEHDVFAQSRAIVVTSEQMRELITTKMPEVTAKISVFPNYVDLEHFYPIDKTKDYDLVFVGRFAEQKNLQALLCAVRDTKTSILMIGSGNLEAELRQEFADIENQIHWVGRINNTDLAKYINSARIYVQTSLFEGHPKTIIEAMACGMPILASDVRGINEVITHQQTGYLCATDANSIAEGIGYLLAHPEIAEKLGHNALSFAGEHYSLDRIAQKEYELLYRLAGR